MIAFITDEEDLASVLEDILGQINGAYIWMKTPEELDGCPVYAVLLVDIRIPSLGGARLVHEVLRRCLGKAGAIVFTGTCPLKDWGSLLDGWPYVQMPFDMNELLRVIRSAKDGGRGAPMGSA